MVKGIVLGLFAQVAFVVGFTFIDQTVAIKSQIVKTSLVLCFSGVAAVPIATYFFLSSKEYLSILVQKDLLYLALGSVFALLIGEVFYITGISSSNVTTVSYTALAYPVVALLFDSVRGRAIMTTQDIIGFAFVSIGFLVLASRNSNL